MFLHIRLGDYVGIDKVLSIDYYKKCLQSISTNVRNIYVFSNDIDTAIQCFNLIHVCYKFIFITNMNEVETLYSMARMKYGGICANSSLSWWGAWLNTSQYKTIFMPKIWWGDTNCIDIHPLESTSIRLIIVENTENTTTS